MRLLVAAARAWRNGSGKGAAAKAGRRNDVGILGFIGVPEPEDGRRDEVGVPGFVGAPEPKSSRKDDIGVPGFVDEQVWRAGVCQPRTRRLAGRGWSRRIGRPAIRLWPR